MKKIIGITGGTGAGKSTVCHELKKLGAEIVDCDKIARCVVEKGQPALCEIVDSFGYEVLDGAGNLDRKKMGAIVFSDPEKLSVLNKITHRHIFEQMRKQMEESVSDVIVLDVPLLFQCDFPFECDVTVAVVADEEERIRRLAERDGIDRETAMARMTNQLTNEEYAKLADVCFENNGDIEKVRNFAEWLCEN